MTDEQKFQHLLKVLKEYAEKKHFGEVYSSTLSPPISQRGWFDVLDDWK